MRAPTPTLAALLIFAAGCAQTAPSSSTGTSKQTAAQCDLNTQATTAGPAAIPPSTTASAPPTPAPSPPTAPSAAVAIPHDEHAIHNLYRLGPNGNIISGGVPEGDAGFDELKRLGVKVVISVDGATPDVARAEARGMRYVHIPITYAEVSDDERLELARAIRDLEPADGGGVGGIYIHCHHGKHRSPAATAAAAVTLGRITPEEGVAFMKTAGTAANYTGLYHCVSAAAPAPKLAIDRAPADFPAVRRAQGIVAAMIEVDFAYEHLGEIRTAIWKVPADHPDLVPAAEAGRLADNLRFSHEDSKSQSLGTDFLTKLDHAIKLASDLEESLIRGDPADQLDPRFKLIQASCKDCHASYRDKRVW